MHLVLSGPYWKARIFDALQILEKDGLATVRRDADSPNVYATATPKLMDAMAQYQQRFLETAKAVSA